MSYKTNRPPRYDITKRREELGLSMAEVSRRSGIDYGLLSRVESGKRLVSLGIAPALAKALEMEILQLLYPPPVDPALARAALREAKRKAEAEIDELNEQLRFFGRKRKPKDPQTEVA